MLTGLGDDEKHIKRVPNNGLSLGIILMCGWIRSNREKRIYFKKHLLICNNLGNPCFIWFIPTGLVITGSLWLQHC